MVLPVVFSIGRLKVKDSFTTEFSGQDHLVVFKESYFGVDTFKIKIQLLQKQTVLYRNAESY